MLNCKIESLYNRAFSITVTQIMKNHLIFEIFFKCFANEFSASVSLHSLWFLTTFLDAIASLGVGLSVTKIVKKSDGLKVLND